MLSQLAHLTYLVCLLAAIAGLAVLDYRYKLAWWSDRRATQQTLLVGVTLFGFWDGGGILLDIFVHGGSRYMLPFTLYRQFPVEELFFLTLLCYQSLIAWRGLTKFWHWRQSRGGRG